MSEVSLDDVYFNKKILEGIYNHLPLLIIRMDSTGSVLDIKGFKYEEDIYVSISNDSKFFDHLEPVFREGKSVFFHLERKNFKKFRHSDNYAFPISDKSSVRQAIVISIDITKDYIARETLNKKNSELKAIFDAIPDVYFRLDNLGIVLDYKSASISQLYIPEDVFIGKSISNFLPNNLSYKVTNALDVVNKTDNLYTLEYNIPMGSTKRYFEARFFPLYEGEVIAIIREITDKVNFQERILEKERLLLETQKIAKVFSFFWDLEENRVTYTDEFYNMVGISPDEIEQTPDSFIEFIHPEDKEMVIQEVQTSLKHNSRFYVEYRFLLPSGKIVHMMSEGKIKLDQNGAPKKLLGLTQDITLRKEYELELVTQKRELERLLNNIEGIVSNQTTEVVLAKEKAEQASQAKTLFLANMSHELKTPIHAIMSFAELGKEKAGKMDRERIEEYFSIIYESGRKLYNLMGNILDISKIDSGKEQYQFKKNNLLKLTQDLIREFEGVLSIKEISIHLEEPKFETVVEIDKSKIMQVIRNLLSNAIKFSPKSSTIQVQFIQGSYNFPSSNKKVKGIGWKVRDQGLGIQPEEKEEIFEKFMQGRGIKAGMGGTGLGLAICKEIISAHNGIIYAENHPKGGAEFVFLVPLIQY